MTCADCKHAEELSGLWIKLKHEFVRCTVETQDGMNLTAKSNACVFQPVRWMPKE